MATTLTEQDLRELVDEGGKLHGEISVLEQKKTRLDQIKDILRDIAKNKARVFPGNRYTATIETKPPAIARVVPEKKVPKMVKLAGRRLFALFSLHPFKGAEKNFELNARKLLPKENANAMISELTVEPTPWVRFS